MRGVLAGIAGLSGDGERGDASATAALLAQRLLAVDPGDVSLQKIATSLSDASTALGRGDRATPASLLDRAATDLATALRSELQRGPTQRQSSDLSRLAGALADARRRAGVSR